MKQYKRTDQKNKPVLPSATIYIDKNIAVTSYALYNEYYVKTVASYT